MFYSSSLPSPLFAAVIAAPYICIQTLSSQKSKSHESSSSLSTSKSYLEYVFVISSLDSHHCLGKEIHSQQSKPKTHARECMMKFSNPLRSRMLDCIFFTWPIRWCVWCVASSGKLTYRILPCKRRYFPGLQHAVESEQSSARHEHSYANQVVYSSLGQVGIDTFAGEVPAQDVVSSENLSIAVHTGRHLPYFRTEKLSEESEQTMCATCQRVYD